jgi:DNA topoisomerase I
MTIPQEEIETLIKDPQEAASIANLVYFSETDLTIYRKKHGRGYIYKKGDKKISDSKELERFKSLVIPPAWKNVRIAHLPNAHLQVVGQDEKERKQYKYHPLWSELRNQTKFFKMISFGKTLPKIRKRVDEDLDLPDMNQRKVLALVIRLMEETHIRIGNAYYAKKNKTYGLSTLRSRHVKVSKNTMKFEFVGKKGKEHSVSVKNRKLIKLVNQCEEIPGWELFKFYDENGNKQAIDSSMINEYVQEISGNLFSAKDFRTWSASKIFFETLYEIGHLEEEKENKKALLEAFDAAAQGLGNTRTVCRSYYVHPQIVNNYESGEIVNYFNKIKPTESKNYASLTSSEKVLLDMISDYEIELNPT